MRFKDSTNKFYKNRVNIVECKIGNEDYINYAKAMLESLVKLKNKYKKCESTIKTAQIFLQEMYQQDIHISQVTLFLNNLHIENIDKFMLQWKNFYRFGFTPVILN